MLMVFWVIGEPVGDMLGRAVFVTEDKAFLGDMGVYSRVDGSRVRRLQAMGVSPGLSDVLTHMNFVSQ